MATKPKSISYDTYLSKVHGGWLGKCIGGTIGARFEGNKDWIELKGEDPFPAKVPPNDDLDLQILWLKVFEEKGLGLTADDLSDAWLQYCWYPFAEYGNFRRNYRMGIHAPVSGTFCNQYWDTGMGCPIRAEIWGYALPGLPELAATYAQIDGELDHASDSMSAERYFAAMASSAFFDSDIRGLIEGHMAYLDPKGKIIIGIRESLAAFDEGLDLREARERVLLSVGNPEACDSRVNVPFTILALLYGKGDLEATVLAGLACGYDTDCTMATAGALIGQIIGADKIPAWMLKKIGDELVVGIAYNRPEPTISALSRDTVKLGVRLRQELPEGPTILNAPKFSESAFPEKTPSWRTSYEGKPALSPGESLNVTLRVEGTVSGTAYEVVVPKGWDAIPAKFACDGSEGTWRLRVDCKAENRELTHGNLFHVVDASGRNVYQFGVCGAVTWRLLGVFFDVYDPRTMGKDWQRAMLHTYADLDKSYLPEPAVPVEKAWAKICRTLGRMPFAVCRELQVRPADLTGLNGRACLYLSRSVVSPVDQEVFIAIGHSEPFRLFLNEEMVGECTEQLWWTPFNTVLRGRLRKGSNSFVVKWITQDTGAKFSMNFKPALPENIARGHHPVDWSVDLGEDFSWMTNSHE